MCSFRLMCLSDDGSIGDIGAYAGEGQMPLDVLEIKRPCSGRFLGWDPVGKRVSMQRYKYAVPPLRLDGFREVR